MSRSSAAYDDGVGMAVAHPVGELIEDREVERFDDDRLGHQDVVDQLVHLVQTVPTPSNIALYGAWGSGKSGIGKMLQSSLPKSKKIRYARFDAFKYAQNPLRRNFVSVVASALGQRADKYHADLYSGSVDTDFKVPMEKVLRLLWIFAIVVTVCLTVVLTVVGVFALIQNKDAWAEIVKLFSTALPASLIPATLMTAVIALVGKTFVREKRVERADSDEEFEKLFRDLVEDSGADRVVIFVDEIDRCAPEDVVETLNAVRTFLGVKRCVFVVAADPQVIEQALTEGTSQANPADELNPYYSAGSAYLDKVFQYQITLPPLMPQSVTSFAVDLVSNRPGLWERIDIAVVASILIPTHVRSPRRVKNLLNSFALAYRLAEARHDSGLLDVEVADEVDELARIVCLRVEFPLFARDLVSDPNLSDYVLRLSELPDGSSPDSVWDEFPYVKAQTKRIAQEYAGRKRHVDRLMVEPRTDAATGEDVIGDTATQVAATHGQQLLDYLSRTRLVEGPTKALIHLQDSGPLFGLPSSVAEQLELDSQNGSLSGVRAVYSGLDEDQRGAAVDLLVQQARTALGYESQNIARAILAVLDAEGVLTGRAESIAMVVGPLVVERPQIISDNTVVGAWNLALSCDRSEAMKLGLTVLKDDLAETSDSLFVRLLSAGRFALSLDQARFGEVILARLLVEDPGVVIQSLRALPADELAAVLDAVDAPLVAALRSAIDTYDLWLKAQETRKTEAAPPAAAVRRAATPAIAAEEEGEPDEELPYDCTDLLDELARLVTSIAATDKANAEHIAAILHDVRRRPSRDEAERVLRHLAPIESLRLTEGVLRESHHRVISLWPKWLSAVTAGRVSAATNGPELVLELVVKLRESALGASADEDAAVRATAETIEPLLRGLADDNVASIHQRAGQIGEAVHEEDGIPKHTRSLEVAMVFAGSGLCASSDVMNAEALALVETLETVRDVVEPHGSELATYVLGGIELVLSHRDRLNEQPVDVSIQGRLLDAIASCSWMNEFDAAHANAIAATLATVNVADHGIATPVAQVVNMYQADMAAAAYSSFVRYWLTSTDEELSAVLLVLQRLLRSPSLMPGLLDATVAWRGRAGKLEQRGLLEAFVGPTATSVPADNIAQSVGLRAVPDSDVADILLARYNSVTTNPKRVEILHLWELAQITDRSARERMIREALIPIFRQGVTAVEPGLGYLARLARPVPPALKKTLGDAVVEGARGRPALEKRAQGVLAGLGYRIESRGLFGHRKEIDTSQ